MLRPLARLLRPLVRVLIRTGVTFPVLADLLRALYVEVATREMLSGQGARTDSRVSLLTGVHRKEIRRLREQPAVSEAPPAAVTLGSQIVARWLGTPAYAAEGRPRPLPRSGDASFETLVESVTTDLRARAVLDDWLDQGIVSLDGSGLVVLNESAFIPRPGREAQLFYFSRNLHDHIAAAGANILAAGAAPFLDRTVHYDRLSPDSAARLEAAGREAAQRLLLDINRLALAIVEADEAAGGPGRTAPGEAAPAPTRRVNLGVFLYVEDEPADEKA
ncbi:DUF6502 family protein [Roseomonas sp. NAR14]|uniref:DUF6502 family protein n=1 Tax=Roseomonas acroporae TaxID=2937791 RepID=A0A9X2BSQ1_9PROT|nr:DUF6502 family protein [Roseomonas acroporae]MCK8783793.1 DUF6502 family protein [Roseomonas acroporae]